MSRPYLPPKRIGRVAYLQEISRTGLAVKVSVESTAERKGRTSMWVPISQIHDDSEIFGIDREGKRQTIGDHGSLIVTGWWAAQDDNATKLSEHEVLVVTYEPKRADDE